MEKTFISFDGTKIYYLLYPGKKKQTLVFLHGVGGNWTVWKKEIAYFQKKGFPILTLDLRGHGLSEAPAEFSRYQLPYFSRDLRGILKKEKITSFSLIGHSLGGAIALNYCFHYPKRLPQTLILIETANIYPFDHNRILNLGPYLTHLLRFIASHQLTKKKKHFFPLKEVDLSSLGIERKIHLISYLFHLTSLRTLVKTLDNAEKFAFHNQKRIEASLRNFPRPCLLIAGKKDQVVLPQYSYLIKKLNKKAQLKILPAGHQVIVEKPEEVCSVIKNFLKKFSKS